MDQQLRAVLWTGRRIEKLVIFVPVLEGWRPLIVRPNGVAFNLVDGVIRARYREGFEEQKLIEPGKIYKYDIDLWATSYVLSPGDRLRVDITSSNFPRLARNLNTGAPFAQTTEMKVAQQTIHMSSDYASRIVVPVIPR